VSTLFFEIRGSFFYPLNNRTQQVFFIYSITSSQEEPLQAQLPAAAVAVAADKPQGQVPSMSLPLVSS
jgi:hypothetical protein